MYCKNCGAEIDDNAVVCPKCGVAQKELEKSSSISDTGSAGWKILGFVFPLIGLILYLVWKTTNPLNAKAVGKGALIGVIVMAAITLLLTVLGVGGGLFAMRRF